MLFRLMIKAFDGLPERALAKELLDLKSVGYMISYHYFVVTSFIIITKVIRMQGRPFDFLRI